MSLADVMSKGGAGASKGPPAAVKIKVEPLSVDHAGAALLKAIEAKDATSIADALRLAYSACQEEYEQAGSSTGGDSDAGEM